MFLRPQLSALPMDLESPDWDRRPSLLEAKEDPYTTPVVKQEDIKLEDVKLEDVKHEDTTSTALVLSTPPASTTPILPPPPKTPPILPPPYRNLSTRTTTSNQPQPRVTTQHAGSKPLPPRPPPSTSSSTSNEDPVILTTHHQCSDTTKITSRSTSASTTSTTPFPNHTCRSSTDSCPLFFQQHALPTTSHTPPGTGHYSQTALQRQTHAIQFFRSHPRVPGFGQCTIQPTLPSSTKSI